MQISVSVVIPAFNEAATLPATIRAVSATGIVKEIIVVDDGSKDSTAEVARGGGARVLQLSRHKGKGAAMGEGVKASTGEIVVFLDADLGEKAGELVKLVSPIIDGEADLAIARLPSVGPGRGMGFVKGLGKLGIEILTGKVFSAPLSGQRAARRQVFLSLLPFAPGWGAEVGMTIDALRAGYRVVEVDTEMAHRVTGRDISGFIHRGRQFVYVFYAIAARISRRRGLRTGSPVGGKS
ncbi:MAG TPA: glycosyltransferase family 2 protein [Firmicutes bacterium]|nr:glycosyltransferase family 2 protein [Bacillota bacterium]